MVQRRRSSFLLPNVHVPNDTESEDMASWGKHLGHVLLLLVCIFAFQDRFAFHGDVEIPPNGGDLQDQYNPVTVAVCYLSRFITLLWLPQFIFQFCGLVFFNAFNNKVYCRYNLQDAPTIAFRIITRGTFPGLIRDTVKRNLRVLDSSGIQNYIFEIITDEAIGLEEEPHLVERVIPFDYQTKHNSLYKARALQYCLDEPVEPITHNSWVVHLDEESILTEDSVRGIINFCCRGKHHFGFGLVTYASNDEAVNWVTTLTDAYRVADDLGQFRFQFKIFHKPIYAWKGSFTVANQAVEKRIGFDRGMEGSITEDQYFALSAARSGYSFDFVEGEVWERSPLSLLDQLLQRVRRLQGGAWIAKTTTLPLDIKALLQVKYWAARLTPLALPSLFFGLLGPVPTFVLLDMLNAFVFAMRFYGFIFGVIRTFPGDQPFKTLCVMVTPFVFVWDVVFAAGVAIWAAVTAKNALYIVEQDLSRRRSIAVSG